MGTGSAWTRENRTDRIGGNKRINRSTSAPTLVSVMLEGVTTKLIAALGSFLGGSVLMAFMKPNSIPEAIVRGFVTTVLGFIFTPVVVSKIGWNIHDPEEVIMVAFCIGFFGWTLLGAMANFFRKNQDKDIFEVYDSVKSGINKRTTKRPAVRKK